MEGGYMVTERLPDVDDPLAPDIFGDAWASVLVDLFDRLKERGELPDRGEAPPEPLPASTAAK
jgi:hypothetical protein